MSAKTAAEYLAEYRSDPENEREFQAALKRDSAQAPASEETCKNCHEPIYRDGVYRHRDDDKVDCTLMAEPVSDPSPELRERIARVLYAQDSDAGPVFYAQEYADIVDAVLVALGEPK